jgi:hypothetical protein
MQHQQIPKKLTTIIDHGGTVMCNLSADKKSAIPEVCRA